MIPDNNSDGSVVPLPGFLPCWAGALCSLLHACTADFWAEIYSFSLLLFLWGGLFHFQWSEQVADGELWAEAVPLVLSGGIGGAVVLWEYF